MDRSTQDLATNRRASYDYEILETFEVGLVLQGTEIKSLRNHGGSLQESYVKIHKGSVWLVNCHIAPYRLGNIYNHEERRERKLLLHKREILRLKTAVQEKGMAIIPLQIYLNKKGWAKLRIALARGKKNFDKRADIKEKDEKRQLQQALKQ